MMKDSHPVRVNQPSRLPSGLYSGTLMSPRTNRLTQIAAAMIGYLWPIVFCQAESELAPKRTRLLLCSSHILLVCVQSLSSWECRLFAGPSSCQNLHPKLRDRRLETLRS